MNTRKLMALCSTACLVLGLAAPALNPAGAQPKDPSNIKPVELSLALMMPSTHTRWSGSTAPWIKMVEERTGGKVKIVPYFAEALVKSSEIYAATVQGIADMGEITSYRAAGRFPLTNFFLLPGLEIPDSVVASRLHWDLIEKVPEFGAQYADTKMLVASSHGGSAVVIMSKEPIRTLEDMKGKKFFIGSPVGVAIARTLGCAPVQISMADVYMSVEKGVLDGVISSVSLITSRKYGEIMKNVTIGPTLGGAPFIFFMNLDKWNSLPRDVQKVFNDLGGEFGAGFFGERMIKDEQDAKEIGQKEYGCQFYKLPPDELDRWLQRLRTVQDDWVEDMEKKNLPVHKVMSEYQRFVKSAK